MAYDLAEIRRIIGHNLGLGRVEIELNDDHFKRAVDSAYKLLARWFPQYGYQIIAVNPGGAKYKLTGKNVSGVLDCTPFNAGSRFEEAPYYVRWVDRAIELGDMRDTQQVFGDEFEWRALQEQDPVTFVDSWWVYVHFTRSTFIDTFARLPQYGSVQFSWVIEATDDKTVGVGRTPLDLRQWVEDYSTAKARLIMGDVRNKFSGLPGASDESMLPTDGAFQTERADQAIAKLEKDLQDRRRQLPLMFF